MCCLQGKKCIFISAFPHPRILTGCYPHHRLSLTPEYVGMCVPLLVNGWEAHGLRHLRCRGPAPGTVYVLGVFGATGAGKVISSPCQPRQALTPLSVFWVHEGKNASAPKDKGSLSPPQAHLSLGHTQFMTPDFAFQGSVLLYPDVKFIVGAVKRGPGGPSEIQTDGPICRLQSLAFS